MMDQILRQQNQQENMSLKSVRPHTPLLYCNTEVYRGTSVFRTFDPKHRLWVLVRTASPIDCIPTIDGFSKHIKNIFFFPMKNSIFNAEKISLYCMGKFS